MYLRTIAWIDVCVIVPDAGVYDHLIDDDVPWTVHSVEREFNRWYESTAWESQGLVPPCHSKLQRHWFEC